MSPWFPTASLCVGHAAGTSVGGEAGDPFRTLGPAYYRADDLTADQFNLLSSIVAVKQSCLGVVVVSSALSPSLPSWRE